MPQAEKLLTIPLSESATGILHDISTSKRRIDLVDMVHVRLEALSAMLLMMKNDEDLPQYVAFALNGIQMAVEDAASLLSVSIPD